MKTYTVTRKDGRSPVQWEAKGESPEAVLANWEHCFGVPFVIVPTR